MCNITRKEISLLVDPARHTGLLERSLGDISEHEISKADAD